MIKTVFFFPNGMVAVCDEHGKQMPEFQGRAIDMEAKIRAAASPETEFNGTPVLVEDEGGMMPTRKLREELDAVLAEINPVAQDQRFKIIRDALRRMKATHLSRHHDA